MIVFKNHQLTIRKFSLNEDILDKICLIKCLVTSLTFSNKHVLYSVFKYS